jgi:hypothetical protein
VYLNIQTFLKRLQAGVLSFTVNMKTSTIAAPLLLVSLSNAIPVIEPRQSLPSWLSNMLPSTSTLMSYAGSMIPGQEGKVTPAEPKLRKNAKRDIIRYGPFTLPGNKVSDFNLPSDNQGEANSQ